VTFLICAIGFPLLAGVLSLGCGLLVQRAAGGRLPGALLVPAGFAGIVVVSQLGTGLDLLSDVTPILVALLAVAGFALGRRRLAEGAVDWWAAGAAVAVYLLVAAPVLLSGTATFAAYGLDTTGAVQLMGADFLLHHAHDFSVLEPSAYAQTVVQYFEPGYPSGSHTAFAAIGWLTGQDLAWLYTEYMAFLVAVTVLGLYALVRRLPLSALACAAVAGIAAMPMLVYAYALQGAIKEMATLPVIALLAALVPWFADSWREHWSRVVPLAVACAAGLATIGVAFAPWLAPFALAGLVLTLRGGGRGALRGAGVRAAAFVVLLAVCALPTLILLPDYLATTGFLTAQNELGNLLGPLRKLQSLGIWLTGDYRGEPGTLRTETFVLAGVAVVAAGLGAVWVVRRRAWGVILFLGVSVVAWAFVTRRGSPWADAKALMIFSPAVVLTAMLGAMGLASWGRRVEGLLLAIVVSGGVLWSDALAYHDTTLAPRERLEELSDLNEVVAGRGPTLAPEFEDYSEWFLRDGQPDGPSISWALRPVTLRDGGGAAYGQSYDLDQLPLDYVMAYPSIVIRRSPAASRPPSPYRLVARGAYYEAWRRPATTGSVVEHYPLALPPRAVGVPRCSEVRALGRRAAAAGGQLAASTRPESLVLRPAEMSKDPSWSAPDPATGAVQAAGPGRIGGPIDVAVAGRYRVALQGSFSRATSVLVDGRVVGTVDYEANEPGQYSRVGVVELSPGRHTVLVLRAGGDLRPGNGSKSTIGPIVFTPDVPDDPRVNVVVPPARWRELCGRPADWIEIVRPGAPR